MTSATDARHAALIDAGWTQRHDGYLLPPSDWPDRRAHSAWCRAQLTACRSTCPVVTL